MYQSYSKPAVNQSISQAVKQAISQVAVSSIYLLHPFIELFVGLQMVPDLTSFFCSECSIQIFSRSTDDFKDLFRTCGDGMTLGFIVLSARKIPFKMRIILHDIWMKNIREV